MVEKSKHCRAVKRKARRMNWSEVGNSTDGRENSLKMSVKKNIEPTR
jgi:hypothetical protein